MLGCFDFVDYRMFGWLDTKCCCRSCLVQEVVTWGLQPGEGQTGLIQPCLEASSLHGFSPSRRSKGRTKVVLASQILSHRVMKLSLMVRSSVKPPPTRSIQRTRSHLQMPSVSLALPWDIPTACNSSSRVVSGGLQHSSQKRFAGHSMDLHSRTPVPEVAEPVWCLFSAVCRA